MDIRMPSDFDMTSYLAIERQLSQYLEGSDAGNVPGFSQYAGGWNAVVIRFRAADEYGAAAAASLAVWQGSLANEDRYVQERDLFGFFANVVATMDSACFSLYHMGMIAKSPCFTRPPEEVTIRATTSAISAGFPGTAVDRFLTALTADSMWMKVKARRNILLHRESPGRTFFVGAGAGVPAAHAAWTTYGDALDASLVEPYRSWLGAAVGRLAAAILEWVQAVFPAHVRDRGPSVG